MQKNKIDKRKIFNVVVPLGITISFLVLPVILFLSGGEVFAQTINPSASLDSTAGAAGLNTSETSLASIIGSIIYAILGFLGVIFIILTIYGGFLWMTARGNADQTKKARGIIVSAVIGVIIITASFVITAFVLSAIGVSVGERSAIYEVGGEGRFDGPGGGTIIIGTMGACYHQEEGGGCIVTTEEVCNLMEGGWWYEGQICQ